MLLKNEVYCGDCMEYMSMLPDNSIDITVTSPPYNLNAKPQQGKWTREIKYDVYSDNLPEDEYLLWQQNVLRELWRITKTSGAIYYNHRPRIQKGRVLHRFDLIPEEINIRQVIVWKRPGGHNFNRGYFVPSYEWIFLLAKPEYKLKSGQSGYSDVWELKPAKNDHVAPFPIDIPLRAISASERADVVFDPFMGSGTTALAAAALEKTWTGAELSEHWIKKTYERVNSGLEGNLCEYLKYY